ncbi:hypothetical protein [Nocardioides sp.]|uniref:hypothetical protein n=1 Tax=Nocardioides sp. TaxID=35761 RepID=UPI0035126149
MLKRALLVLLALIGSLLVTVPPASALATASFSDGFQGDTLETTDTTATFDSFYIDGSGDLRFTLAVCEKVDETYCITESGDPSKSVYRTVVQATYTQAQYEAFPEFRRLKITVTGLKPNTTYRWYAISDRGPNQPPATQGFFEEESFTTKPPNASPFAIQPFADSVTTFNAQVSALVGAGRNAEGTYRSGTYQFVYGTSPTALTSASAQLRFTGVENGLRVKSFLLSLASDTTYYARAVVRPDVTPAPSPTLSPIFSFRTAAAAGTCASGFSQRTLNVGKLSLTGCLAINGTRAVARGTVRLNGLNLEPGGRPFVAKRSFRDCVSEGCKALQQLANDQTQSNLVFDATQKTLNLATTGEVQIKAGTTVLYKGALNEQGRPVDGSEPIISLFSAATGSDRDILGFALDGGPNFTPNEDGKTGRININVSPPFLGGVTGEVQFATLEDGGAKFDGIGASFGYTTIGIFDLPKVSFRYSGSEKLWRATASVPLPTPKPVTVEAIIEVKNKKLSKLSVAADDINQPIAKAVFLQKIGFDSTFDPFGFSGTIGLSAGPQVIGKSLLRVDGTVGYAGAKDGRPASLFLGGELSVVSIKLATAEARVYLTSSPWVTAKGTFGVDLDPLTVNINADFLLNGDQWFVRGGGRVSYGKLAAQVIALAGNDGFGACGGIDDSDFALGFYQPWGGKPEVSFKCPLSQFPSAARPARVARAAAARATTGGEFTIAPGAGRTLVRFLGTTDHPEILLEGPNGETVSMPAADEPVDVGLTASVLRALNSPVTEVALLAPAAGTWTWSVVDGSAPVESVTVEKLLGPAQITGSVTGTGARRTVTWRSDLQPGERLELVEIGEGVAPRRLLSTTKASGSLTFAPRVAANRARRIQAQVVRADGALRGSAVIDTFTAPKLVIGRATKLALDRGRSRSVLTWKRAPGAVRYRVLVDRPDGRRLLYPTTKPRLTIPGIGQRSRVAVTVRPVLADGRDGPAVRKVFTVRPRR